MHNMHLSFSIPNFCIHKMGWIMKLFIIGPFWNNLITVYTDIDIPDSWVAKSPPGCFIIEGLAFQKL